MEVLNGVPTAGMLRNCVMTIGTFDGVHLAHKAILERLIMMATERDVPSVLITFDPHPRSVLAPEIDPVPLLTLADERVELLSQTGLDYLIVYPFDLAFAAQSPESYLEDFILDLFDPSVILIGFDHRYGKGRAGDFELMTSFCRTHDIELIKIEKHAYKENKISSSAIRKALASGQIEEANAQLGYEYRLSGRVVHGEAKGRTIGYPTANIALPSHDKLVPQDGVYAASVAIDGVHFDGLLFIGPKSGDRTKKVIEVHIKDWEGDLYDKTIRLSLVAYIRGTMQFASMEELQLQIRQDESDILSILRAYGAR